MILAQERGEGISNYDISGIGSSSKMLAYGLDSFKGGSSTGSFALRRNFGGILSNYWTRFLSSKNRNNLTIIDLIEISLLLFSLRFRFHHRLSNMVCFPISHWLKAPCWYAFLKSKRYSGRLLMSGSLSLFGSSASLYHPRISQSRHL